MHLPPILNTKPPKKTSVILHDLKLPPLKLYDTTSPMAHGYIHDPRGLYKLYLTERPILDKIRQTRRVALPDPEKVLLQQYVIPKRYKQVVGSRYKIEMFKEDKSLILPSPSYLRYLPMEKKLYKLPTAKSEQWTTKDSTGTLYAPFDI